MKEKIYTFVRKAIKGAANVSYNPTNTQKVAMDVNMDGTINLYDMIALQNYINGAITSF